MLIATRIERLLAGSALRFGGLNVKIAGGKVLWIAPAPQARGDREEWMELEWLFERRA